MDCQMNFIFVMTFVVAGTSAMSEDAPFLSPSPIRLGRSFLLRCSLAQFRSDLEVIYNLSPGKIAHPSFVFLRKLNVSTQANKQDFFLYENVFPSPDFPASSSSYEFGRDVLIQYRDIHRLSEEDRQGLDIRAFESIIFTAGITAEIYDTQCKDIGMYLCRVRLVLDTGIAKEVEKSFYADNEDHKPVIAVTVSSKPLLVGIKVNVTCTTRGSVNATLKLKIMPEGGVLYLDLPTERKNFVNNGEGKWPEFQCVATRSSNAYHENKWVKWESITSTSLDLLKCSNYGSRCASLPQTTRSTTRRPTLKKTVTSDGARSTTSSVRTHPEDQTSSPRTTTASKATERVFSRRAWLFLVFVWVVVYKLDESPLTR